MAEKYEVRTQIYLKKSQHEALKKKAGEQSTSMAHLIREAVAAYLAQAETNQDDFDWDAYKNDPIWNLPEMAKQFGGTGFPDAAENHDHYIYDLESEK